VVGVEYTLPFVTEARIDQSFISTNYILCRLA